jgi:ferredoxin
MKDIEDGKKQKMYPAIDPGCCTLCEGCVEIAPEIFRLNSETGLIEVLDLPMYRKDLVDEAIKICPEDCISWER